jgi:hypothetical protein
MQKINGKRYYIFKAEFNVHAKIASPLAPNTVKIEEKALIEPEEKLGCDAALITSTTKNFSSALKSNFTATHSGNIWEFFKQTNVKVITPRQQIVDAMQKRLSSPPIQLR